MRQAQYPVDRIPGDAESMQVTKKKILFLDIETAPHTAHVWGLFKQNIAINQIQDTGRVLCFAWRWMDSPERVQWVGEDGDRMRMLEKAHKLLDDADIVVTYNGKKFDIPTLNKEFIRNGLGPPAPFQQVDLLSTTRREFRFASNKLDHVARELGIGRKVRHSGHELWVRCMAGDKKAWHKMARYNKRDVTILEKLYYRLRPWIKGHPNNELYCNDTYMEVQPARPSCPRCSSKKTQARGTVVARTSSYRRYVCGSCGGWFRSAKIVGSGGGAVAV